MLAVKDLQFAYGENLILKGISFNIFGGQFTGIIGPNGSGKSTLLKNISGYLVPQKGKVLLQGKDIKRMSGREKAKHIAYVPQNIYLDFDFTCREIVEMGRIPYKKRFEQERDVDREVVENAMKMTNTWDMRDDLITEISGGERQRVIIARALCQQPKLLLLDEPVSHLDIKYQYEVMELMVNLCKKGITVLAVLHDLSLASQFCENLILLQDGQIVAQGSPEDVITAKNIYEVYQTEVMLLKNPINGMPIVLPEMRKENTACLRVL